MKIFISMNALRTEVTIEYESLDDLQDKLSDHLIEGF